MDELKTFWEKVKVFLGKAKLWMAETGLNNLGWAAGFGGAVFLGWTFAAGVCAGIFVHLNYAVIKDIVNGLIK